MTAYDPRKGMTLEQWLRIQLNRGFDRFEVDVTDGEHGSLHLNFQPLDSLGDMAGFERAFLCFGDFISHPTRGTNE